MLLSVLSWLSWPFDRERLWLSAPLFIGCIALGLGWYLLMPFTKGYGPLNRVIVQSSISCVDEVDAIITATGPGSFVVAIVPKSSGSDIVDSVANFRSILETTPGSLGGKHLSPWHPGCDFAELTIETLGSTSAKLTGYSIGSAWHERINDFQAGSSQSKPKLSGLQLFRHPPNWSMNKSIVGKNFLIEELPAGSTQLQSGRSLNGRKSENRKYVNYRIAAPDTMVMVPGSLTAPMGMSLEQSLEIPSRKQKLGISALMFTIECPNCRGKGHLGNRLVLALNHGRDEWSALLGSGLPSNQSRVIAMPNDRWQVKLIDELHGDREQVGKTWVSKGIPVAEVRSLSVSERTVDGFSWERADWTDREQSITIFASLLLGLGATLLVELFIVTLHRRSVGIPSSLSTGPTTNRSRPLFRRRFPMNRFQSLKNYRKKPDVDE
jgi:hypothetical protein